ncbi:hypothetical protein MAQ5080_02155 [Marinomonas aquimarina]|uniref:Periplasmic protein n=1 Tax=Marinomonas aquimarina TaxID=295068 RepID=A0A1A8TG42_9GAMM|nr:Spy/CpxP family protein refolding chaperone [Marinomonas aquimarina]SBS32067.1 hypothetical protein MAQ5080_02155 [Marinomonas aquimarina]
MTMFNGKAFKLGAMGLATVMAASFATTGLAEGKVATAPTQAQQAPRVMDPYSEPALDRMALTLQMDVETKEEASKLFAEARQERHNVAQAMQKLRGPMISLDPKDDDYVDQIEELAEQRSELMVQLDVQQAEIRHKFYELLSDEQIQVLESSGGKH